MRKTTTNQQPQNLKKKLMSALAMLMVATTLMTTTSYAWFVLSTAPEVTGISTNVGANGSLEIALLNADTYSDLSLIRSGVGDSMVSNNHAANNAWGNLVDLGYQEYGLNNLTLMPARLMVTGSEEAGYTVDTNLLAVPTYGFDGRVVDLDTSTYSAVYQNGEFAFTSGQKDYGVRAIGISDALSAQGSALASAKANIPAFIKNARSTTAASLTRDLLDLIVKKYTASGEAPFNDTDKESLNKMIGSLESALTTVENALRQGLIAYAASEVASEDTFNMVKDRINAAQDLSALLSDMAEVTVVPGTFATWATKLESMQNALNTAKIAYDDMTGGSYTWDQISGVLNPLMNMNGVYVGNTDKLFTQMTMDEILGLAGGDPVQLTLKTGSGIYADMADFVGNYNSNTMEAMGLAAYVVTVSDVNPSYLNAMNAGADGNGGVQALAAADGGEEITLMPLDATYGYAIDMAFRCNAANPDLVLQTAAIQRVYSDSESGSTQGGGSYMAFSSADSSFSRDQMLALMDALRVAFVNDQGNIMAVAKLNITNNTTEDGMVKAPLYLYDFTFEPGEDGGLLVNFGERLREDNVITALQQNVAKAVTAVVWLDGDLVDNTMVSATVAASLNGVMNLQFATNAQLVPAHDDDVKNWTANATIVTLMETVLDPTNADVDIAAVYAAGKTGWSTASWNTFAAAYQRVEALDGQVNPGEVQIRNAVNELVAARAALTKVSKDAVNAQVTQLRNEMGKVAEITGYFVTNEDGTTELVTEFTGNEEWIATATPVYGVNYSNNNLDGEEGVQTPIYTDKSWNDLANALYNAELIAGKADATDEDVDAALTALETAKKALTYQVKFLPYEYKETVYYKTSYDVDVNDAYGDWYDSSFNRITSEVLMLNLKAYAEPAEFISVNGETYVPNTVESLTVDTSFLDAVYPELRDVQVKGVKWSVSDDTLFTPMMSANHQTILQALIAKYANDDKVDTTAAEALLTASDVTAAQAEAQIAALQAHAGIAADVVYGSSTGMTLKYNGGTGTVSLTATILTTDGVVTTVTKTITVYEMATGAAVDVENVALEAGQAQKLTASLVGGTESISSVIWASQDTDVATVAADGTVTAVAAGSTTISASVQTREGNAYTIAGIAVNVTAPANP